MYFETNFIFETYLKIGQMLPTVHVTFHAVPDLSRPRLPPHRQFHVPGIASNVFNVVSLRSNWHNQKHVKMYLI